MANMPRCPERSGLSPTFGSEMRMNELHGFLIVDKPSGVTSFSIVSLVRRLTDVRRVGHAGTLDPLASGVLPVAIGHATRLIEYLDDELKTYVAAVHFGTATDTYDAEGIVTATVDAAHIDSASIEAALRAFVGSIEQRPPLYSALKVAGKPLYRYAREGADVAVAARRVYVESATLHAYADGVAEIEVRCGKGTYIRSLAHDLGAAVGCVAHLAALRRTSTGGFAIEQACAPQTIEAAARDDNLADLVLAPDRAVERRPAAIFDEARTLDVTCGRDVTIETETSAPYCRAYSVSGDFLGVLENRPAGVWHPAKIVPIR